MTLPKAWKPSLAKLGVGATFALVTFASGFSAQAQITVYNPNFDTFTTETLSGQPVGVSPNWDTNDADNGVTTAPDGTTVSGYKSVGQSDYVGFLQGYSPNGSSQKWGVLGGLQHSSSGVGGSTGVVPGASTVYLFNNFSVGNTNTYSFNVDFAIPESTTTAPAKDSFAWTFQNGATNLFSIDFAPDTTNANGTVNFGLRYTVGNTQTSTTNGIVSSSIYHLGITVNVPNKTFVISLTPSDGSAPFTSDAIFLGSGVDANSVTDVAATWILSDTSNRSNATDGGYQNAGTNALVFRNYVITVPEPSTWALTGLAIAGLAVFTYRRRACV